MIVNEMQKANSLNMRGRFGYSGGFGKMQFSWNKFGFYSPFAGIYCKYKKGKITHTLLKRFYRWVPSPGWLSYDHSLNFRNATLSWKTLTTEQKEIFNQKAKRKKITGYNLYISEYIKSHPI